MFILLCTVSVTVVDYTRACCIVGLSCEMF